MGLPSEMFGVNDFRGKARRALGGLLIGMTVAATSHADGSKIVLVNTDEQKLYAWEGDELVYEFHVVTGRPGKETTAGAFATTRKYEDYTSRTYGSEMPYSMFFTLDGKAIHGTKLANVRSFVHAYLTESVGSQGCVGLAVEEAALLFAWAPLGTRVHIIDDDMDE
jgi:lipoprotein-anchoring transpeptidase ErfK/SrfK